jgi:hypothetical protein
MFEFTGIKPYKAAAFADIDVVRRIPGGFGDRCHLPAANRTLYVGLLLLCDNLPPYFFRNRDRHRLADNIERDGAAIAGWTCPEESALLRGFGQFLITSRTEHQVNLSPYERDDNILLCSLKRGND